MKMRFLTIGLLGTILVLTGLAFATLGPGIGPPAAEVAMMAPDLAPATLICPLEPALVLASGDHFTLTKTAGLIAFLDPCCDQILGEEENLIVNHRSGDVMNKVMRSSPGPSLNQARDAFRTFITCSQIKIDTRIQMALIDALIPEKWTLNDFL